MSVGWLVVFETQKSSFWKSNDIFDTINNNNFHICFMWLNGTTSHCKQESNLAGFCLLWGLLSVGT